MKTKSIKPIIISALMAVSFGATAAGTTFALFTDRADTKIEVTAGIVDLSIAYDNLKAYSLDENDNTQLVEVSNGKFATEGTYALDATTGKVTLNRMVPGDKVEFDIKLTNKSNVKTKYRFAMSKTGTLAPYLHASFGEASLQWTTLGIPSDTVNGDLIETAHVVIDFPNTGSEITVREEGYDNSAQGLSATYVLGYEMVQGNAHVVDTAPAVAPATVEQTPVASAEDPNVYTFDIMSEDALVGVAGIAKDENKVTLTVAPATEGNFSIEGATTANYDIQVANRKEGEDVTVKLYVGEGYETVYVYHDNETTPLANTSYNPATGYVTFTTASFSPFHFAAVRDLIKTKADLLAAVAAGGVYHIGANIDMGSTQLLATSGDVTIYGHDYKLMSTASRVLRVQGDFDLSIHNWDIYGQNVSERALQYDTGMEGDMYLDDVNIYGITMYTINFCNETSTHLTIKNSHMEGWGVVNLWTNGFTVDVDNCEFVGLNDKGYNADGWNNFGIFVLEGDTTGETDIHATNNICRIKNTKFVANSTTGNMQYHILFNNSHANNEVYLTNCTYETRENGELKHNYLTYVPYGTNKFYEDGEELPQTYIIGGGAAVIGGDDEEEF